MKEVVSSDTVYLIYHDEISQEKAKTLMEVCTQAVMQLNAKTIYLELSSGGGDVNAAITLYNFLRGLPCEIVTHNIGSIDSAANVVFMGGEKRYAAAHTSFLFHGVRYTFGGAAVNRAEINEGLGILDSAEEKMAGIIAKHSGMSEVEVKGLFADADTRSATFAKDKGIITAVKDVDIPEGAPVFTINAQVNP